MTARELDRLRAAARKVANMSDAEILALFGMVKVAWRSGKQIAATIGKAIGLLDSEDEL